ncbi:pyridoxal phosphate-dependent aminotransferase [Histidinibacterium aquaticum]|uniref:Aminotransferase n=1 Tax=Histidinibacterium aquaticum TaxID=2613962 RepID=A0A5J5GL75_9RHOB|nr:aminotransferase class I/II-fold pyridoxal phosphate-dependent enzyme [Histidinibacterium aquaticum]KAA9008965.1 aminotransferase class I/II-fold pyridoxal phosphate-dependent enzyme [Histidinibacterium aquaticum]
MRTSRRGAVDPFIVMDVVEAAQAAEAAGRHIVHMEIGQPGTGAPRAALDRLAEDMRESPLGYSGSLGLPELRARIARHYGEWYDLDLDPSRVIVTAGASGAFVLAFSALFDTGARVGLGEPCYPSYRQILSALGMEPVAFPTSLDARFQPVPSDLDGLDLDGLIVASPANPSGTALGRQELSDLSETCDARGVSLISDEIYHGLGYSGRSVSALEVTDEVVVINSFSKYFAMTGWRVGWMVVPEALARTIERLAQNLFICAPHAGQRLALHAMDCTGELEEMKAVYARNRELLLEGLPKAGLPAIAPPDGAFYVYADVSEVTDDSRELARRLLDEAGVAVAPGADFDRGRGDRWLRFSYSAATSDIEEGLVRIARFMGRA